MKKFSELTTEQRREILDNKLNTDLLVDRITLSFEDIENELSEINISQPFEVPPIILDEKHFFQILIFSGSTNKARWLRTLAITYIIGGKVIFQKIDDDNFKASLIF